MGKNAWRRHPRSDGSDELTCVYVSLKLASCSGTFADRTPAAHYHTGCAQERTQYQSAESLHHQLLVMLVRRDRLVLPRRRPYRREIHWQPCPAEIYRGRVPGSRRRRGPRALNDREHSAHSSGPSWHYPSSSAAYCRAVAFPSLPSRPSRPSPSDIVG
jgi:hypothetical protein